MLATFHKSLRFRQLNSRDLGSLELKAGSCPVGRTLQSRGDDGIVNAVRLGLLDPSQIALCLISSNCPKLTLTLVLAKAICSCVSFSCERWCFPGQHRVSKST